MDGRDGMRAADADRQAVADRLRVALDEGRLDLHEYDERLQRAYAARTYGDLDALLTDLPGTAAPGASEVATTSDAVAPRAERAPSSATARWLADVWSSYFRTVAIVVSIWAATSLFATDLLYFWPVWVAGPWGAVLLMRTVGGLAGGEPRRWAAEQEQRRERRLAKRARKRERKRALADAGPESPPRELPAAGTEHREPERDLPTLRDDRREPEQDLSALRDDRREPEEGLSALRDDHREPDAERERRHGAADAGV